MTIIGPFVRFHNPDSKDAAAASALRSATLRELVVQHPAARPVLEAYGLDYCCGGGKALEAAAAASGADRCSHRSARFSPASKRRSPAT